METIHWTASRRPRLSRFLARWWVFFPVGIAAFVLSLAVITSAVPTGAPQGAYAMLFWVAMLAVMATYGFVALKVATARSDFSVAFGDDGFVFREEFYSWSDVRSAKAVTGGYRIVLVSGRVFTFTDAPLDFALEVTERLEAFRAHPAASELPASLAAIEEGYRVSDRGILVRVATNPRTESKARVRAVRVLIEAGASREVAEACKRSAHPQLRRWVRN